MQQEINFRTREILDREGIKLTFVAPSVQAHP
jgi:hypothetical protein